MTATATGTAVTGTAHRTLFSGLFDDAALFPPGNVPMDRAVAAHQAWREGPDAALTGLFVCPDTRLAELATILATLSRSGTPDGSALRIALVVPAGPAALGAALRSVGALAGIEVAAVELPIADVPAGGVLLADVPAGGAPLPNMPAGGVPLVDVPAGGVPAVQPPVLDMPAVPLYLELPLGSRHADAVAGLAGTGYRVKIRTGGTVASAFPDEPTLAAAIASCVRHGVAFKLTAGLHHAVRHRDPATGFEHHGFLNVLLAVAAALDGATPGRIAAVLGNRDAAGLAHAARGFDQEQARRVRETFVSFGTCSVTEPLADLVALGLLDREGR